jgi:hypothetical protein
MKHKLQKFHPLSSTSKYKEALYMTMNSNMSNKLITITYIKKKLELLARHVGPYASLVLPSIIHC